MVQQSKPWRANSFIAEYSPLPGTLRSNTRDVTDEPWTKNTTGRAGSLALGAPIRLRNIHKGMSPFLVQYSLLQISPPSEGTAVAACAGIAAVPATPRPRPLRTVRRAIRFSEFVIASSPRHISRHIFLGRSVAADIRSESRCAPRRANTISRSGGSRAKAPPPATYL